MLCKLDKMKAELSFIKHPTICGNPVEADEYEVRTMEEKIKWQEFQERRKRSVIKTIV